MNKENLKVDFYAEVNKRWLKTAKIREDRPYAGAFVDLDDKNEKLILELLLKWSQDHSTIPTSDPQLTEMVKYFEMTRDYGKRQELGISPALPIINALKTFDSFDDIYKNYKQLALWDLYLPLEFGVETDFKDSSQQILFLSHPSTILPAKNMYENEQQQTQLYEVYKQSTEKILAIFGYSPDEASQMVQKSLAFDQSMWKHTMAPNFYAKILNLYNMVHAEKLSSSIQSVDFSKLFSSLLNHNVEEANVVYPEWIKHYDEIFTQANFENYKARLIIDAIYKFCPYLTDELRVLGGAFSRAVRGVSSPQTAALAARNLAISDFKMVFGRYYGKTYFGPEAKANVEVMVDKMIEVYKRRLLGNSWLSTQTIDKAIVKLSTFKSQVGYPEKINPYYAKLFTKTYEEGSNVLANHIKFKELKIQENFDGYLKPKDRELWGMSPAEINAYYSPSENKIVFPAAILQEPFYSLNQSSSQNYGGIGAVMAHEISHGFDNNGANYDEYGNINNWWTEEDYTALKKREQSMIDLFEGAETEVGPCNGELVVSENIADNGGLACAYEAAQKEQDFNAEEFMINHATIWRAIYKPEYAKLLLSVDVHAPAKLRVNLQLPNLDDFYKVFDIHEGDPMYIDPEKRVHIW